MATRLSGCEFIFLGDDGSEDARRSYEWLEDFTFDYIQVPFLFDDYEALLGAPSEDGAGFLFGVVDDAGVERWVTLAEGLEQPNWGSTVVQPALADGSQRLSSRIAGREIQLRATLRSTGSRTLLAPVLSQLSSVFVNQPRWGWLNWDTDQELRRIPVVFMAPTKTKWVGERAVEVELSLQGIDVGSAGRGVWLETLPQEVSVLVPPDSLVDFDGTLSVDTSMPVPIEVDAVGPVQSLDISLNGELSVHMDTGGSPGAVPAGERLIIAGGNAVYSDANTGTKLRGASIAYELTGGPDIVSFPLGKWPTISSGSTDVNIQAKGVFPDAGTGSVTVRASGLW